MERLVHSQQAHLPPLVPLLSRGRHRNPRKGACFMEMASYLAGERWSDHPACTHPLLAGLARLVNDHTSDEARPRLAPLIPSVIGLNGDDPRVDARIALVCAIHALPVAAAERQLALAVSILAAEHVLARLEGRPAAVLADVPVAARQAQEFRRGIMVSPKGFRRFAAPNTVHIAVRGVAEACVTDPDDRLRAMLSAAIDECSALLRPERQDAFTVDHERWTEICRVTGAR
jgi:hypothetical protein